MGAGLETSQNALVAHSCQVSHSCPCCHSFTWVSWNATHRLGFWKTMKFPHSSSWLLELTQAVRECRAFLPSHWTHLSHPRLTETNCKRWGWTSGLCCCCLDLSSSTFHFYGSAIMQRRWNHKILWEGKIVFKCPMILLSFSVVMLAPFSNCKKE